ncbi:ABC transporter permease, partial [Escherichia coli]
GATRRNILQQFLVESALISLLGGVIGILLGVGMTLGVARGFGWNPVVSPASVLLAVGVSASIGIFFGIWPAKKAASLH